MVLPSKSDDVDGYWNAVDDALAGVAAAPELELLPARCTEYSNVYAVRLTSIGPYRIFGYLSVPVGPGRFPGFLITPRYGSVNHLPHLDDRKRYVVFIVMHRGQRLADQPFAASYPGLLTMGIESPDTYIYRAIVADCLRGAEFLASRPEVDTGRIGIMGDDLALITASRRTAISAACFSGLMFFRLMEARTSSDAYPIEEVNDYLRTYPDRLDAVASTLAHFDPTVHASRVVTRSLLSVGSGIRSGPDWVRPLTDELGDRVELYTLSHEGGTDHDHVDAWLASELEVAPAPRLWTVE